MDLSLKNKKILIIDNFDSFTYNLAQLFGTIFNGKTVVKRSNKIDINLITEFDAIVLSPGPQRPKDHPINSEVIKRYYQSKPILGICLGMQCINEVFQGKTVYSPKPMHGKTSLISHSAKNLFKDIPQNISVARYHSLMCKLTTNDFTMDSIFENDIVMAITHKKYPIFGIQFHPESFMTEYGNKIVENFIEHIK